MAHHATLLVIFGIVSLKVFDFLQISAETSLQRESSCGTSSINEYISEFGEHDEYTTAENTMCVKVTYPSMLVFPSFVDEAVRQRANLHIGDSSVHQVPTFLPQAIANHRKKKAWSTVSFPSNTYIMALSNLDSSMYVCVYHDPSAHVAPPGLDTPPDVSVDWFITGTLSSNRNSNVYELEIAMEGDATQCYFLRIAHPSFILITPVISFKEGGDMIGVKVSAWFESAIDFDSTICVALDRTTNITTQINKVSLSIMDAYDTAGALNVNSPEDNNYALEYGHTELGTLEEVKADMWHIVCVDKSFEKKFEVPPLVFTSLSYRLKVSSRHEGAAQHWVEFINENGFRACATRAHYESSSVSTAAASIAFIEYLVMTQNGVKDTTIDTNIRNTLMVVLNMKATNAYPWDELPNGYATLHRPADKYLHYMIQKGSGGIVHALDAFTSYGFYFDNVGRQLIDIVGIKLVDGMTASILEQSIEAALKMDDDRLVYRDDVDFSLLLFFDYMYPQGMLTPSNQRFTVRPSYHHGCIPTAYVAGSCSVNSCHSDHSGVRRMQRTVDGDASCAPTLTFDIECNGPPCSVSNSNMRFTKGVTEDHEVLWIVLAISGALGVCLAIFIWRSLRSIPKIKDCTGGCLPTGNWKPAKISVVEPPVNGSLHKDVSVDLSPMYAERPQ